MNATPPRRSRETERARALERRAAIWRAIQMGPASYDEIAARMGLEGRAPGWISSTARAMRIAGRVRLDNLGRAGMLVTEVKK